MKLFFLILFFFISCKSEIKAKLIGRIERSNYFISEVVNNTAPNNSNPAPLPTSNDSISPPINFSYPKSKYFFRINRNINLITPVITGQELSFSVSPSLPTGLVIDSVTGIISGAATSIQADNSYTVSSSNRAGSVQTQIRITVVGLLPLKTGYSFCWDSSGTVTSCAGTGQDGEFQNGTIADFSIPTDSTSFPNQFITMDNLTGLKWISCAVGFSGSGCTIGGATLGTWNLANSTILNIYNNQNLGQGFAGINSWRLPTISELERIHLPSVSSPSVYNLAFPNNPSNTIWSGTNNPTNSSDGLIVNFVGNGRSDVLSKTTNIRIRYVSGTTQSQILVDNGDGTILDVTTGLVWQKCSFGLSDSNCSTGAAISSVWNTALNSCNTLSLSNYSWRLPNLNELKSVLERSSSPILNSIFFPNPSASFHFTSTTSTLIPSNVYRINFSQSIIDTIGKTTNENFKCVATLNID